MHRQSTDILQTEHGHSADRARTFCRQSTDIPRTEHGRSADRAWTFCGSLRGNSPEAAMEFCGIYQICVSYLCTEFVATSDCLPRHSTKMEEPQTVVLPLLELFSVPYWWLMLDDCLLRYRPQVKQLEAASINASMQMLCQVLQFLILLSSFGLAATTCMNKCQIYVPFI